MEGYNMISEARARANAKYDKKTYSMITAKVRKDSGLKEKAEAYADSQDITLSQLIIKSLEYIINHNIKL